MSFKPSVLGRKVQFDERSKLYPVRELVEMKKLRSYTWRCNTNLDQGEEGACVGFGVAHELAARPSEVNVTETMAREIYLTAQKIDPWEGGAYPNADPFYEGTSVLAGVKVARMDGWMEEYRWAFGLHDLILGVGYNGPAILGVSWHENMVETDNAGYIQPTGNVIGGHCILCNAVSIKEKRFTLHNSWGEDWGKGGECYITFDNMDKLLHDEGEAVFFLHRHKIAKGEK